MFTQKDSVHVKNLQRLLAKAKIELEGQEILAAADVLLWVGQLNNRIDQELQRQTNISKENQINTTPESAESLPKSRKKANVRNQQ